MKSESITKAEAQKLILHSQQIITKESKGNPLNSSLNVIEQLGYIQIDTISVVQRAHHHTLWSRNHLYSNDLIDKLVEEKKYLNTGRTLQLIYQCVITAIACLEKKPLLRAN